MWRRGSAGGLPECTPRVDEQRRRAWLLGRCPHPVADAGCLSPWQQPRCTHRRSHTCKNHVASSTQHTHAHTRTQVPRKLARQSFKFARPYVESLWCVCVLTLVIRITNVVESVRRNIGEIEQSEKKTKRAKKTLKKWKNCVTWIPTAISTIATN